MFASNQRTVSAMAGWQNNRRSSNVISQCDCFIKALWWVCAGTCRKLSSHREKMHVRPAVIMHAVDGFKCQVQTSLCPRFSAVCRFISVFRNYGQAVCGFFLSTTCHRDFQFWKVVFLECRGVFGNSAHYLARYLFFRGIIAVSVTPGKSEIASWTNCASWVWFISETSKAARLRKENTESLARGIECLLQILHFAAAGMTAGVHSSQRKTFQTNQAEFLSPRTAQQPVRLKHVSK